MAVQSAIDRSKDIITTMPQLESIPGSPFVRSAALLAGIVISLAVPAVEKSQMLDKYMSNIQQLTFEGDNAEAYFSGDGTRLILSLIHI